MAGKTSHGWSTLDLRLEFGYDALGRRIEQSRWTNATGTITIRFGVDGQNVWADLDGSNSLTSRYIRPDGIDALTARINAAGAASWYLTDRLGSVRINTDSSGDVSNRTTYNAFGGIVSQTNPSAADRYAHTGRELLDAGGLQYHRWRVYDTRTGTWLSRDPIGFDAGDTNLYRYVENNPVNFTDPDGRDKISVNGVHVEWVIQEDWPGPYNPDRRYVWIGYRRDGDMVEISTDFGGGWVPLQRLRTFADRFWREYPDISKQPPTVQNSILRGALTRIAQGSTIRANAGDHVVGFFQGVGNALTDTVYSTVTLGGLIGNGDQPTYLFGQPAEDTTTAYGIGYFPTRIVSEVGLAWLTGGQSSLARAGRVVVGGKNLVMLAKAIDRFVQNPNWGDGFQIVVSLFGFGTTVYRGLRKPPPAPLSG